VGSRIRKRPVCPRFPNYRVETNGSIRLDFREDNSCSRRHTSSDDRGIVLFRRTGLLLCFAPHSPQTLTWWLCSGLPNYSCRRDNDRFANGRAQDSAWFHRGLRRLSSTLCLS